MKKVFISLKAAVCCLVAVFCTALLAGCGEKTNQSTPSAAQSVPNSTPQSAIVSSAVSAPTESSDGSEPVSSLVEIPQLEPSTPIVPSSSFELDSDLFVHKIASESLTVSDWKLTFKSSDIVFMPAPDDTLGVTGIVLIQYYAQYLGDSAATCKLGGSSAIMTGPAGEDLNDALNKIVASLGGVWDAPPDIVADNFDMTGTAQGFFWLPYTTEGMYTIAFTVDDEAIAILAPIAGAEDIGSTWDFSTE